MHWSRFATTEQARTQHCLVHSGLSTQRHFTPRPKIGLQARGSRLDKVNTASDLFGALSILSEHRTKVLELVNILQFSPSSMTTCRYSPGMSGDITLVFEALMSMSTVSSVAAEPYHKVSLWLLETRARNHKADRRCEIYKAVAVSTHRTQRKLAQDMPCCHVHCITFCVPCNN